MSENWKQVDTNKLKAQWQAEFDAGDTRLTWAEYSARHIIELARLGSEKAKAEKKKQADRQLSENPAAPVDKINQRKEIKKSGGIKNNPTISKSDIVHQNPAPDAVSTKGASQNKSQRKCEDKDKPVSVPSARIEVEAEEPTPESVAQADDIEVLASGLTARQELFCREYLADRERNGTRAALKAGYNQNSAHVAASRLLKHDKVRAYMQALLAPHLAKLDLSAERILEEYKSMAFANNYDYLAKDEAGLIKTDGSGLPMPDFSNLSRAHLAGLASMEVVILPAIGEDEPNPLKVKWKLNDKKAALDVLAKRVGVLKEEVTHSGEVTVKMDDRELAKRIAFMLRQASAHDKKES